MIHEGHEGHKGHKAVGNGNTYSPGDTGLTDRFRAAVSPSPDLRVLRVLRALRGSSESRVSIVAASKIPLEPCNLPRENGVQGAEVEVMSLRQCRLSLCLLFVVSTGAHAQGLILPRPLPNLP